MALAAHVSTADANSEPGSCFKCALSCCLPKTVSDDERRHRLQDDSEYTKAIRAMAQLQAEYNQLAQQQQEAYQASAISSSGRPADRYDGIPRIRQDSTSSRLQAISRRVPVSKKPARLSPPTKATNGGFISAPERKKTSSSKPATDDQRVLQLSLAAANDGGPVEPSRMGSRDAILPCLRWLEPEARRASEKKAEELPRAVSLERYHAIMEANVYDSPIYVDLNQLETLEAQHQKEKASSAKAPPQGGSGRGDASPSKGVSGTEDAVARAKRIWQQLDVDKDGSVDYTELMRHLKTTVGLDEPMADRVFQALDRDANGKIDLEEWLRAYAATNA